VQQAHYSILQHLTIMNPLVNEHLSMIRDNVMAAQMIGS